MFLMVAALLALTAFMFVVAGVPAVAALFAIATVLWVVRVNPRRIPKARSLGGF